MFDTIATALIALFDTFASLGPIAWIILFGIVFSVVIKR